MNFIELLQQRRSHNDYDAMYTMSDEDIKYLVGLATLAPSAYHLQNWHFIAVCSKGAKEQLFQACYGQEKVRSASVTYIVCGNTDGYRQLHHALAPSLTLGQISKQTYDAWIAAVQHSHTNDAKLRYTEAIRSASLAAMTLILAAENMGYATGAMSGFDVGQVQQLFQLDESTIPVLLVTVGKPVKGRYVSKSRLDVDEVMSFA